MEANLNAANSLTLPRSANSGPDKKFRTDRIFCNIQWDPVFGEDGLIVWTLLYRSGDPMPFSEASCPLVSFVYKVPDVMELKQEPLD